MATRKKRDRIKKLKEKINSGLSLGLMRYQQSYIQQRLEQIPTFNLIDTLTTAGINIIDAYQQAKKNVKVNKSGDMTKAMYKIADSLDRIELLSPEDIAGSLIKIWDQVNQDNLTADAVKARFKQAVLQEWYGKYGLPKKGTVWTSERQIQDKKTSILDSIIEVKTQEKTETYLLKSPNEIRNVIALVQRSLQGSLNNMNGILGEEKAYRLIEQILSNLPANKSGMKPVVSGSITGQERGYVNEKVAVQAKPDIILTYIDNNDSNNTEQKIIISAKQYKSTTMALAKTQTALSLLHGTSEFYLNGYFMLQGRETPANTYVSSYMYFILGMNGFVGNLTHYAQQANQQGQRFIASNKKIPAVNNFVGFCEKSMYVLSAKDFLQEFFQQIPKSNAESTSNLAKYKQTLVVHGSGLKDFLMISKSLPDTVKDKSDFYNIKLNVHLNMLKATQKHSLQAPLLGVFQYINSP